MGLLLFSLISYNPSPACPTKMSREEIASSYNAPRRREQPYKDLREGEIVSKSQIERAISILSIKDSENLGDLICQLPLVTAPIVEAVAIDQRHVGGVQRA